MKDLLIPIVIVYSVANIIAHSGLFSFFREWLEKSFGEDSKIYELFTCMMCLPTWIGFILSSLFILTGNGDLSPVYSIGFEFIPLVIFLDGMFFSATSWLIHTVQEFLEGFNE